MDCISGIHLPEKYRELYKELLEEKLSRYSQPRESISIPYLLKGLCGPWSITFRAHFPDLTMHEGFYGHSEHFWCTEPDGTIVDPTVLQFYEQIPDLKKYRLFDEETDEVYLGKCMNCGWEIYGLKKEGQKSVCGEDCGDSLSGYYNDLISSRR